AHIRGAVAARAVAVERADREVITGRRDQGDVGEGRRHRRSVAGQTPAHALVRAGDGVEREVTRRRVALGAHGGRGDVIGGLAGAHITGKGRRGRVAAVAVAARRVELIQRSRTRISGRGRGAGEHADVGRALVTGRAGGDRRRDGGVASDREGRSGDARRTELEAPGIHIRGAVAAR